MGDFIKSELWQMKDIAFVSIIIGSQMARRHGKLAGDGQVDAINISSDASATVFWRLKSKTSGEHEVILKQRHYRHHLFHRSNPGNESD